MQTVNLNRTVLTMQALPEYAQQQVADFVDFLKSKYATTSQPVEKITVNSPTDEDGIESIFGLVKAKRSVSLEEMQEAIEIEGSKL